MKHALGWVSLSLILFALAAPAWAADEPQEPAPAASDQAAEPETSDPGPAEPEVTGSDVPDLGPQMSSKVELTPEEKAEKEGRKACKIEICDIIATREPLGPDIACDIKKTWRAGDLTKMLGDQIGWPWGNAVCQSDLKLERAALAEAMRAPKATMRMNNLTVSCALQRAGAEPYVVEAELSPEVTFENGKAVSATVNWGDVSAPMMIYPILYAGTGLDNQSNVLGPEVVRMVNHFTTKSCAEVKDELPGRRVN